MNQPRHRQASASTHRRQRNDGLTSQRLSFNATSGAVSTPTPWYSPGSTGTPNWYGFAPAKTGLLHLDIAAMIVAGTISFSQDSLDRTMRRMRSAYNLMT